MKEINCFDKIKFDKLQKSGKVCLLQFWSAWCGDCFDVSHLKELSALNNVFVFRVNFEDNEELANKYSIKVTPSYVFLKNFKVFNSLIGKQTANSLRSLL
jgi:thioredoxin 1